jgi:hypothetical protein
MVACCIKRLNRERIKKSEKKYYLNRIVIVIVKLMRLLGELLKSSLPE